MRLNLWRRSLPAGTLEEADEGEDPLQEEKILSPTCCLQTYLAHHRATPTSNFCCLTFSSLGSNVNTFCFLNEIQFSLHLIDSAARTQTQILLASLSFLFFIYLFFVTLLNSNLANLLRGSHPTHSSQPFLLHNVCSQAPRCDHIKLILSDLT